jgi:hypothetical protein
MTIQRLWRGLMRGEGNSGDGEYFCNCFFPNWNFLKQVVKTEKFSVISCTFYCTQQILVFQQYNSNRGTCGCVNISHYNHVLILYLHSLLPTPLLGLQHSPSLYSPLCFIPCWFVKGGGWCGIGSLHGRVPYNDIVISGRSSNPI